MTHIFLLGVLILPFCNALLPVCTFNEVTVRPVTPPITLGQNPHWDDRQQVLYFPDVYEQTIYRFDPLADTLSSVYIEGGPVSLAKTTLNENRFIATRGLDVIAFSWDGVSRGPLTILASVDGDKPDNRLNDGKADANGRMWISTNSQVLQGVLPVPNQGTLYSFSLDNGYQPKVQIPGITVGSGIGWNNGNTLMYYTYPESKRIVAYEFDQERGRLGNGRTVFDLEQYGVSGYPDGFAVDENDLLWVALYNGSRVIQVDPLNGELLRSIPVPVRELTGCAFGGPDLSTLYVTTAKRFLEPGQTPLAGALYAIDGLDVKGQKKRNIAVEPLRNYETQSGWEEPVLVDTFLD